MDASTTVQVSGFEKPQIEGVEVAERHCVLLESALLKAKGLELGHFPCALLWLTYLISSDTFQPLNLVLQSLTLLLSWIRPILVALFFSSIVDLNCLFVQQIILLMQLSNQGFFELEQIGPISFQSLPKSHKWSESLSHKMVSAGVRDFNEESNGHQVKGTLFVQVTEPLHNHQQVVLLCQ